MNTASSSQSNRSRLSVASTPERDPERLQVSRHEPLPSPSALRHRFPLSSSAARFVAAERANLSERIRKGQGAPLAIVGPCSIHCETAALEYAERLQAISERLAGRVQVLMRVYFEKPRTNVGWKGFLYDPELNGSDDLRAGLERARELMVRITEMGVPIATEILDPLAVAYLGDCLSWVAIGARTSESQIHRQMASDLSCPVGFKNGTDGNVSVAADACLSGSRPHARMGVDDSGRIALLRSRGNDACHVVLRGGSSGPNFAEIHVNEVAATLKQLGLPPGVIVDCSHGNSQKDYRRQPEVARAVIAQLRARPRSTPLAGLMLESHLSAGSQPLDVHDPNRQLHYGVSVTDGCIDLATTEGLLHELS